MKRLRVSAAVIATGAMIAAGLAVGAPASAIEIGAGGAAPESTGTSQLSSISPEQLDQAIREATALGYVSETVTDGSGKRTTTIDLGDGVGFDIVQERSAERLGAGSNRYGAYVSFNKTDQGAIISGAGWALGVGLCAISAGTFCVVAGAILAAATFAVGTNGIRCGNRSLRVYPFNASRGPRCA